MRTKVLAILFALLATGAARAEILSAGANGFLVRHVVDAPNVAPPVVWAALADIAKWWDPEHTYSGDANNLRLDPYVQGCSARS
jgi:hypothetical protein